MTGPVFVSKCHVCGYVLVSVSRAGSEDASEAGHNGLSAAHAAGCDSNMVRETFPSLAEYVAGPPTGDELSRWVPSPAEVSAE